MPDGFREQYVRVDGHSIFVRTRGEPTRGSVLTIHGGPGVDHVIMLPFGDLAQYGYRVVWYDQLGCGRSDRPRKKSLYTLEKRAEEAEAVRRQLRLGNVHLLGYSFGVTIALTYALRWPAHLRCLILGSGFSSAEAVMEDERRALDSAPAKVRDAILRYERVGATSDPRFLRALAEFDALPRRTREGRPAVLSHSSVRPWEMTHSLSTANPWVGQAFWGRASRSPAGAVDGSLAGWNVTPQLPRIRVPTLVTVGRDDTVDPTHSRRIHRGIRRSTLKTFKHSGHGAFQEERGLYMDTLRRFLDRHST